MKKVLVLTENGPDGIYVHRLDASKLREAFVDSIDFEVWLEGIEEGTSNTIGLIPQSEMKRITRDTMKSEGFSKEEIDTELNKI
jgi:hypothetical protein